MSESHIIDCINYRVNAWGEKNDVFHVFCFFLQKYSFLSNYYINDYSANLEMKCDISNKLSLIFTLYWWELAWWFGIKCNYVAFAWKNSFHGQKKFYFCIFCNLLVYYIGCLLTDSILVLYTVKNTWHKAQF